MSYLLGYDIGSSSIKSTLIDSSNGQVLASATSPQQELQINAPQPGWAEQDPEIWWKHVKLATNHILVKAQVDINDIKAIGLSYQMHGLVLVDKKQQVLRPAIIWCDSRAVDIGNKAFSDIGKEICLSQLLNSPGNFTASKLKWVMENEPEIYKKSFKAMLPGDYIAMKMTGNMNTTPSGLSEGIFWNFKDNKLADLILEYYKICPDLIPEIVPTFAVQGVLSPGAAEELGLKKGIKLSYRAGDQPNNAFSLNVLNPGEAATTAGTSGVIYGVTDKPISDSRSRVNTFVHVNHATDNPSYGVLLCINGCGILYSWLKNKLLSINTENINYKQMDSYASQAPVGSAGLLVFPFGNGAERTLENQNIGAIIQKLDFNIHDKRHLLRASQEGIIFALKYGLDIMNDMGLKISTVKAGKANQFSSSLFQEIFSTVTGTQLELYNTDGSQGAARGAGLGAGIFKNSENAFAGLKADNVVQPNASITDKYQEIYSNWLSLLKKNLSQNK
jgi:xylulokinase